MSLRVLWTAGKNKVKTDDREMVEIGIGLGFLTSCKQKVMQLFIFTMLYLGVSIC